MTILFAIRLRWHRVERVQETLLRIPTRLSVYGASGETLCRSPPAPPRGQVDLPLSRAKTRQDPEMVFDAKPAQNVPRTIQMKLGDLGGDVWSRSERS